MKKLSIVFLVMVLVSCVTTKQFNGPFNIAALEGREKDKDVIIIKTNGERFEGGKLEFSKWSQWRKVQKEEWVSVDGQKVDRKDISAIQSKTEYSQYFNQNSLKILIQRIRFGKINLYVYVHRPLGVKEDDVRGPFHVYVFEKEKGKLQELSF